MNLSPEISNGHGDVTQLTDASGNVVKSYEYDAFGNEKNPDPNDTNVFRYCSEYFDKEAGTIYLRARYYDPEIGRFISEDSYWGKDNDPLSLNLYTYAENDPIQNIDPDGHAAYPTSPGINIQLYVLDEDYRNEVNQQWGEVINEFLDGLNGLGPAGNMGVGVVKVGGSTIAKNGVKIIPKLKSLGSEAKALVKSIFKSGAKITAQEANIALRHAYVKEVQGLVGLEKNMRGAGLSSEQIARTLHATRRNLGIKYKNLTSPDVLKEIYKRNLKKYGDKYGPTIEYLREQGKSWDDIIESSKRTSPEFNKMAGIE